MYNYNIKKAYNYTKIEVFNKMNNYLEKLEYNKILEKLSNYATTYLGKNLCINLLPSNNNKVVNNM